ncbi:MAG: hypothetical protein HGB19_04880 [Chlorobiales bacterium]|nr:hypothetical protein [Chlorobiales bacterium]
MKTLQRDRYAAPPLPHHLVRRSGLMRLFSSLDACKLCTVIAPAGYGKTTSVTLFSSVTNDYAFRWVFLQKPDADFHTFVSKVSKSISSLYSDFEEAFWLQYDQFNLGTQRSPDKVQRFGYMVGELLDDRLTEEFVLVLDDYHFVLKDEDIKLFVTGLLEGSPPHFRIIITSRMSVDLDLMLLLSRQQLLQINIDDLRFSEDETEEFILKQLELSKSEQELDRDFISELYTLTDGWAASLVLAVGRLRQRNISEQQKLLSDLSATKTTINQYLSEQIFDAQPTEVQLFLLATSVLPNFSLQLAGLLLNKINEFRHELPVKLSNEKSASDNGKEMTAEEIAGQLLKMQLLYESADDPPQYNYHQLLRDFLISKIPHEIRLKLYHTCGQHFEEGFPETAIGYYLLSEDGHKSLACLSCLIEGHPRLSLNRLQQQLNETKGLNLTAEEQKELTYLRAKIEHALGNIETSESLIRRYLQPEAISEINELPYLTKLLHLKNLNSQQRFGDLKEPAQALIEELKDSGSPNPMIEVQATLILGMAIAQAPSGPDDGLRAMKILDEAWELCKKANADELESEVLRVRYFVAQEIGYEQTVQAFKDRETNSKGTSIINRITALQDYAFMQVSLGNFAEARPRVVECLDLSENYSYSSAIHTSQFLLAECLAAEGKFDDAVRNYEQAVVYYLPISPQTSLTILYRMTECALYKGDIAMAENCAARSNIIYKQYKSEHFETRLALYFSSFFSSLTKQDFKQAHDALAKAFYLFAGKSEEMSSQWAEVNLFQAYLSLSSGAEADAFITSASKYMDSINLTTTEVRNIAIKLHWRLAEAVFQELLSLIDSLEPRQSKAIREFLQKNNRQLIRDILSFVIEQKRSLGIFDIAPEQASEKQVLVKPVSSASSEPKRKLIRIQTFGGLKIYLDDAEGHKPKTESDPVLTDAMLSTSALKATFKILLINHQKPVSPDELFEHVWPNSSSKYHIHMLRNAISRIRKTFVAAGLIEREKELISKTEAGYSLNFGVHGIDYFFDIEEFDYQIHQAHRAYESDLPKKAASHYQKAISLYKGDFLVDDRFEAWVANRQESLKDTYLEALLFLANYSFIHKRTGEVIAFCEQLLKLNPISEEAYELLIKIHLNRGIYSEARKVFERCRKAFRKELNTFAPLRIERLLADERKS